MNFETVIGLEVHVELNTNSKIFSPTSAHFGNEQNTNTNVIDWSFPGVLPVLNKGVVDAGIKAALALNMDIHQHMHFDRKNYFYPDNPKAYQISQFDEPIGYNGWIEVQLEDGTTKKIGIERAHLEEDAGKNTHGTDGFSYVDLNRQGVPLIEIVSEADMRSPEEAYAYLTALKEVIQYTGISDVKMEEGSMRVDANISLVMMKPARAQSLCVSKKEQRITVTSQNQTFHCLKSQMSGLRKCVRSYQNFQKTAVLAMWQSLVCLTMMPTN